MILVIDNFDSFTYNLVQYFQMLGQSVKTVRNNKITLAEIAKLQPSHIVISPGPGNPRAAGICLAVVKKFAGKIPLLGVCLGHQVIIEALGGKIIGAENIVHGKVEPIDHDGRGLFRNLAQGFKATRYHSLVGDVKTLPAVLEITATSQKDGALMGVRHKKYQIEGVQFHPESIGTEDGLKLLNNFLQYRREIPQKLVILKKLSEAQNLTHQEAYQLMDELTAGELTDSQVGAFLGAMAVKGVTADELSASAQVLVKKAGKSPAVKGSLDTCGTGGDGKHTFNISTAAALICAAAGVKIAKHGNRAITSKSGSFDFLQAMNIKTDGDWKINLQGIKENNFAFFFAPVFHSAMKYAAKPRQEIKIRTIFNMIGPLANPLKLDYQIVGVFDQKLLDVFAQTLKKLKRKRAMVLHAEDGLDELSICAKTMVRELTDKGKILSYTVDPKDFGLTKYNLHDIAGGTAVENAELFRDICKNKLTTKKHKAIKAAVCLNAAAGLYIAGEAKTLQQGYTLAKKQIDSGALARFVRKITVA